MRGKATVSALLAGAMLAAGCGGGDIPGSAQPTLETREDAARAYSYTIEYFDAPDGNSVGTRYHTCSGPSPLTFGTVTPYYLVTDKIQCSYSGYECPVPGEPCF